MDAPVSVVPPEPPSGPGPLPFQTWMVRGAILGVVLGVAAAFGPVGALTHGGLLRLGLLIAVGVAGLAAVHTWQGDERAHPWLVYGALGAGVVALMALLSRHPEVHLSPFASLHAHFVGVPVELAFVALGAGALAVRANTHSGPGWWLFASGALWCLAALGMPHHWLGDVSLPISRAFRGLGAWTDGALTVIGLAACLGAGLYGLGLALRARVGAVTWTVLPAWVWRVSSAGVLILALHHGLVGPLVAGAELLQLGMGVVIASLVLLVTWACVNALDGLAWPVAEEVTSPWSRRCDVGTVLVVLGLYLSLKIHGMGASNTDENIYFYMAEALSRGQLPYRDYFFAHPPLHVLIPGAVMTVTGYGFTLAKSFSVLAGAITGLVTWLIAREHFGRLVALTAMAAFLFAAETLKATTNMTGINLTTMWLMLGVWQGLRGRGLTAGILFGLAACTGFYSMGAICAALVLGAFHDKRFAVRQLVGFLVVAGAINGLFLALAGDAYLDGVYRYHGLKAVREAGMVPMFGGDSNPLSALLQNLGVMVGAKPFTREIYYHSHLWLGGLVAPLVGVAAWMTLQRSDGGLLRFLDPRRLWQDKEHGVIAMVWLIALALFVQYAMFRELYSFYFVLIYPTLALCLSWSLWHAVGMVAEAVGPGAETGQRTVRGAAGLLGLALLCLWPAWSAHANKAFPSEQKGVGTRHDYVWRPAPAAESLSGVAESLFWEDHRLRGNLERGYRHYLWTKKRRLSVAEDVASWIAENSAPHETIAGASGSAPLIALLADRRLAAGEADTNSKRFKAGRLLAQRGDAPEPPRTTRLVDDVTYWNAICADDVRYLVSTSRSFFTEKKLVRIPIIQRWFRKAKVFWDDELKYGRRFPVTIYERTGEPLPDGRVCQWE